MEVTLIVIGAAALLGAAVFFLLRGRRERPKPEAAASWHDTAARLVDELAPNTLIASPPVPPTDPGAARTFGTPRLGTIDLTPVPYPAYETVKQSAPLRPGQRWPDGSHMPTREQTKAAIHAGIVRALAGQVADPKGDKPNLKPLDLTRESDEEVREALGELGLESLSEVENWGDVMHLRARLGQGWGAAGSLGAYAPNSLRYVRERRQGRRGRGEKIGFQR